MSSIVLKVGALTAIYLLVLTSVAPGDILVGGVIASCLILSLGAPRSRAPATSTRGWLTGLVGVFMTTARDMALGTIRTVRFCLGGSAQPGFVEIPRDGRSQRAIALWGVLTGEAPDEYPVDVDEERHVLIVHLLDAGTPDAVRERHAHAHERWQRHVVP